LKYEDFVEKPQAVLEMIYSFLELPNCSNPIEVRSDVNEEYLKKWRRYQTDPLSESSVEAACIKHQYGRRVDVFGYSLDN
jgi:hypothetical protein